MPESAPLPTKPRLPARRFHPALTLLFACQLLVVAALAAPAKIKEPRAGRMVNVAGGPFVPLYGTRDKPEVVRPFLLDVNPVTNGDFLRFLAQNPRFLRGTLPSIFADEDYLKHFEKPLRLGPKAPVDAPLTHVSWFAARAYCRVEGKRLPSMLEWEFAARADKDVADATASPAFTQKILDWYSTPSRLPLPPVSALEVNYWGVAGMHGVIWEWVEDFNSVLLTGASRKDASGVDKELFCAAGSLGSVDPSNYAAFLRYAMRASTSATYAGQTMGFRCAKDVPLPKKQKAKP